MMKASDSPVLQAVKELQWVVTVEEEGFFCTPPQGCGLGTLRVLLPSDQVAVLKIDLYLHTPLTLSTLAVFPASTVAFGFLWEDQSPQIRLLKNGPWVFSNPKVVLSVVFFSGDLLLSDLSQRYSGDEQKITHAFQNLPSSLSSSYGLDLMYSITKEQRLSGIMKKRLAQLRFFITNNTYERCPSCQVSSVCRNQDRMGLCSVATYFMKYPEETPSIEQLSRLAGMSETKLKTLFKETYGDTPFRYLKQVRMNLAASYLQDGLSVTDTAFAVGYKSVNRFSEAYRQTYNRYPGKAKLDYRKSKENPLIV